MWSPALHAVLAAASDTAPSGTGDQLPIILGGIITAIISAIGFVGAAMFQSRASHHTAPAPPDPAEHQDIVSLHERVAVLERRADDSDERDETQDRRLDVHERALDIDNIVWRPGDHGGR